MVSVLCYQRYKQGKLMAVFIAIVSIASAVYIGMGLLLFLMQSKMLYYPTRDYDYQPGDYGWPYESVSLTTPDEVTLACWYVPAEGAELTVLFCHGNAGNISHRLDTMKMFNELGLNCLIIDYRGYGKSTGKPTEKGTILDVMTGFQWLIEEKEVQSDEIILFGRSLGGSIAATVAKDVNPAGLVIESAFTSFDEIGRHYYPWLPVRLFSRFDYNTLEAVKRVNCPLLVIHSPDDEIIPFKFGQQIFAVANEPKIFSELRGTHNEGFYDNAVLYKQIWQDWLNRLDTNN
jgi:fermentation-respiration switch protein FrsA (DUF1100 family)